MNDKQNILQIDSLAQFKQAIQLGVKVGCLWHTAYAGLDENRKVIFTEVERPLRKVSHVQGNAFCLATENITGDIFDSWVHYPKASKTIIEDGILTEFAKDLRQFAGGLMEEGNPDYDNLPLIPVISYWIIEE